MQRYKCSYLESCGGHRIDNTAVLNDKDTWGRILILVVVLVTIRPWRWLSSPFPSNDGKYDAVNELDALLSLRQSADVIATTAPGGLVGGCSLLGAGGTSLDFR